jgi:hypothetical protein
LDFHINQTPYSVHLSLRKKFSRTSSKSPSTPPSTSPIPKSEHQDDRLHQELLYTRNEYVRLYNLYVIENTAKCKIEEEYNRLLDKVNVKDTNNENIEVLKVENKQLNVKYEQKVHEVKQLKSDLENMNKGKNTLSVALKAAKADVKEQSKQFDKKTLELEKKVVELSEYRKIKLAEEREVKLKNRKELKKEKQKQNKNGLDKPEPEPKPSKNHGKQENGTKVDNNKNRASHDDAKINPVEEVDANPNNKADFEFAIDKINEATNSVEPNEEENVNLMSDEDFFFYHLWKKSCGRPRPAEYTSKQEKLDDG